MAHDDERFTPEAVDEQVERLTGALHVTPPAQAQPDMRLIDTLQRLYPPDEADARSLERVWSRLERRGVAPRAEEPGNLVPLEGTRFRRERHISMNGFSVLSRSGQNVSLRVASVAALFLLVALVGGLSIGLALVHRGGSSATPPGVAAAAPANIYLDTSDGISKLDAKTHQVLWQYTLNSESFSSIDVVNGVVYATNGSIIMALDASTSKQRWQVDVGKMNCCQVAVVPGLEKTDCCNAIVVVDNILYTSGYGGDLYALNASDGTLRWHTNIAAALHDPDDLSFSSVSVAQGVIYGSSSFLLYAVSAQDGALRWHTPAPSGQYFHTLDMVNHVLYAGSAAPYPHSGGTGARDSYAYAYNPTNGALIWQSQKANGAIGVPAVANGVIYFGAAADGLYAISASDGAPLWHANTGGTVQTTPEVVNGIVYVAVQAINIPRDNAVLALNASDGAERWKYPLAQDLGNSALAVGNGVIYVSVGNSALYAFQPGDGTRLWQVNYDTHPTFGFPAAITFAP